MSSFYTLQEVLQARAGGAVQRCHTVRHQGSYSNAEHSWGVAMLCLQLYPDFCPELLKYALVHDIPEGVTGDVPATVKKEGADEHAFDDYILSCWALPQLSELNATARHVLKSCDKLELWLWAREQSMAGNYFVTEIIDNLEKWFEQPGYLQERAHTFWLQSRIHTMAPYRVGQYANMKEGFEKSCQPK